MANMENIEQDIGQYLADADNLSRQDKLKYLRAIFHKHFALEEMEHQLTIHDFHEIVSNAKSAYPGTTLPMAISKREMYPNEVPQVLLIEAVIMMLNKYKLLRKLVRIEYTTRK